MKQKGKRLLSSAGASVAGAVGGLFKKKEKPAVNNPHQAKKQDGQPSGTKPQSYSQKIKRKVKGIFTTDKPTTVATQTGSTQRKKSMYQRAKQVGGAVSSGISSGYSKVASMIPKKDVCNEQEALMLIRLLQANKKNQLGNFVFKDGEKKIALQGLQKKIKAEGIDSQIKEMYISIKQNIQKQVKH